MGYVMVTVNITFWSPCGSVTGPVLKWTFKCSEYCFKTILLLKSRGRNKLCQDSIC